MLLGTGELDMDYVLFLVAVPVFLVVVYMVVRFGSAAFFKAKAEYERQNNHGKK